MHFKKSKLFIFLAIAISSGLLISCGSDNHDSAKGEDGQLWTCGMHPEVILDEPGQCPICGMNLVPLKIQETASEQPEHT